jgi:hypothetical protein
MKDNFLIKLSICFVVLFLLWSCGNKPVSLEDIEVYPGAVVLKAGESRTGDTLAKNVKTHKDLTESMGSLAGSTQLDQRGFQLPEDTQWNEVKTFYEEKLSKSGWTLGLGGVAAQFVDVNKMMESGSDENSMTHTVIFSKGNQKLTVIMTTSPVNKKDKTLILSLTTT